MASVGRFRLDRHQANAAGQLRRRDIALVVDKWVYAQATSRLPDTGARVLLAHPGFDLCNPNKVYSLVCAFCGANPLHFHAADGSGYRLAADVILDLDRLNPQVASRIVRSFDRIRAVAGLLGDVAEVVGKALEQ